MSGLRYGPDNKPARAWPVHPATSMLGSQEEAPPREGGYLHFNLEWQELVFGIVNAMFKEGHYEWNEFREALVNNNLA